MLSDRVLAMDPGWLIAIGVFMGALLLFEGARQVMSRRETDAEARARRLGQASVPAQFVKEITVLAPKPNRPHVRASLDLTRLLSACDLPPRPRLFSAAAVLLAIMVALVLQQMIAVAFAWMLAFLLCIVMPLLILVGARQAKLKRMVAQLPDALDLMARGLKAGHPLNTSIAIVAETMPDPIRAEFGVLVDQVSYGDDIVTAVRKLAQRIPTEDFQYFAASVGIQHGSGGNLGRVLTVLSQVMRDRSMMRRKIKALSAEGRISALILSCLPFIMFGINMLITPEYYGGVMGDPLFVPLASAAVGLVAFNAIVLFRLVNFRF
jgi:tight adherence protein B